MRTSHSLGLTSDLHQRKKVPSRAHLTFWLSEHQAGDPWARLTPLRKHGCSQSQDLGSTIQSLVLGAGGVSIYMSTSTFAVCV